MRELILGNKTRRVAHIIKVGKKKTEKLNNEEIVHLQPNILDIMRVTDFSTCVHWRVFRNQINKCADNGPTAYKRYGHVTCIKAT